MSNNSLSNLYHKKTLVRYDDRMMDQLFISLRNSEKAIKETRKSIAKTIQSVKIIEQKIPFNR